MDISVRTHKNFSYKELLDRSKFKESSIHSEFLKMSLENKIGFDEYVARKKKVRMRNEEMDDVSGNREVTQIPDELKK